MEKMERWEACEYQTKYVSRMSSLLSIVLLGLCSLLAVRSDLVFISSANHDEVMRNSRLTFVSFTVSWCPFSRVLLQSFTQAALEYKQRYPERKTIWGNVDCMKEEELADSYRITKYPTMKVYFYGHMMYEYRGSRQTQALIELVERMENTTGLVHVNEVESVTQWQTALDPRKGTLIVWFPRNSPPFELILKAVALIHDQLTVVVPLESQLLEHEEHKLWFSLDGDHVQPFSGDITSFKQIVEWVKQKTLGMVRELTFENAEEYVEEGKPMLILFRDIEDKEVDLKFVKTIRRELNETLLSAVNPFLSDGKVMERALAYLGSSPDRLPYLVIDQFVHSYPSPWEQDEIFAEGNIRKFVIDLVNDTLHTQLHQRVKELLRKVLRETKKSEFEALKEPEEKAKKRESVFNKLQPATNRYSFKSEL